jgi:hypothetical protein
VVGRSLLNNGKSDGDTRGDYPTMALAALLPALLSEGGERAFVIGFGTGVSTGELAALESTRRITVAEISPAVVKSAPLFDPFNLGAFRSPKVEIVVNDAYRALLRSEETYDVIVSEPSNPWVSGVEMVYSREFLEAARDRLAPGGVYAQWMHQYETDPESVALVLRTYDAVFEHTAVWFTMLSDILILGISDPANALDLERISQRAARPDFVAGLRRAGVPSVPALLAHEILPLGVIRAARLRGSLHELLHPRLNDQAVRGFFRGAHADLPFTGFGDAARTGRENSLLRRWLARYGDATPETVRSEVAEQLCPDRREPCLTWIAQWMAEAPGAPSLERAVEGIRRWQAATGPPPARVLEELRDLLLAPTSTASVAPAVARRATDLYREYYFHAVPFEPERLDAVWRRCSASIHSQQCAEGRRNARALLASGAGR